MSASTSRLLVVDDEVRNVTALTKILNMKGFSVAGVHTPLDAVKILREENFDLLLTDLMMPGMDGIELLRRAVAIDPYIVGILMTGHGTIDSAVEAMKSGAYDYVLKPFNLNTILPVIERGLSTRQLRVDNASLVSRLTQRAAELEAANRALQAANRELDSFAESISHDLRTPLHAVIGFSEILADPRSGPLSDEQQRFLGHVLDGGRRVRDLTEDLLRFSRLGQQPLQKQQVNLNEMVASIVRELRAAQPDRQIEIQQHELLPAQADPSLIRQALINLLSNAFKYTRGVAEPVIEIDSREEGTSHLYRIRDNGAGFDMRAAKRLFAPFQRLHSERQFEGTGIGLSLVKRIAERHGGYVSGIGEPGKGAEFTLALPM